MDTDISEKSMKVLRHDIRRIVREELDKQPEKKEWLNTTEAARYVGYTPRYLRSIKENFVTRIQQSGRILFSRDSLDEYLSEL